MSCFRCSLDAVWIGKGRIEKQARCLGATRAAAASLAVLTSVPVSLC
jgi:hypothetical protein